MAFEAIQFHCRIRVSAKVRKMKYSKASHVILRAAGIRATVSIAVGGTNASEIVASVNGGGDSSKDKSQKLHYNGR